MASGIWTTEHFTCLCGMSYTATREQQTDKHSGSFECIVCKIEVHAWSGLCDFFDWRAVKTASPVFGKKLPVFGKKETTDKPAMDSLTKA
jgi:hypothetical protein